MNEEEIAKFNNELIEVRNTLERLSRSICSVPGNSNTWSSVNEAIECVGSAIHNVYRMKAEGRGSS